MSKEESALVQKTFQKMEDTWLKWDEAHRRGDYLYNLGFEALPFGVVGAAFDRFQERYPHVVPSLHRVSDRGGAWMITFTIDVRV